jgi:hypothetical protein
MARTAAWQKSGLRGDSQLERRIGLAGTERVGKTALPAASCRKGREQASGAGLQQHFVETPEDGVRLEELPSFRFDRLLETALHWRMILLSHDTLLVGDVVRCPAVALITVGRRFGSLLLERDPTVNRFPLYIDTGASRGVF